MDNSSYLYNKDGYLPQEFTLTSEGSEFWQHIVTAQPERQASGTAVTQRQLDNENLLSQPRPQPLSATAEAVLHEFQLRARDSTTLLGYNLRPATSTAPPVRAPGVSPPELAATRDRDRNPPELREQYFESVKPPKEHSLQHMPVARHAYYYLHPREYMQCLFDLPTSPLRLVIGTFVALAFLVYFGPSAL